MDKVQKIREEVEWLKSQLLRGACSSQIAMETRCKEEAYNEVLAILDSSQKEPKECIYSKDNYTNEDRKILCEGCKEECKYAQKEEPVSEEWIEELRTKLDSLSKEEFERVWGKYGKEEKKEPVSEDLEEAADNALNNVLNTHDIVNIRSCLEMFRFGAKWQKQQMMAKAIDGTAKPDYNDIWCNLSSSNLKDGDKVKIVIIKEG